MYSASEAISRTTPSPIMASASFVLQGPACKTDSMMRGLGAGCTGAYSAIWCSKILSPPTRRASSGSHRGVSTGSSLQSKACCIVSKSMQVPGPVIRMQAM